MSLSEEEFLLLLAMDLDVFLEEYGRLLKEDIEKAKSLSGMASVYLKFASALLLSKSQLDTSLGRGCVYLLHAVGIDLYKIGSSDDELKSPANSQQVLVLEVMHCANPSREKERIQSMFQASKVANEWFKKYYTL